MGKSFEIVSSKDFNGFSQNEQIAFLINEYNFYTIDLIVSNLPLKSGIRDIASPWDKKFIYLFGEKSSLNFIEHDLLRKKYSEPRIHFALVCASKSCPALINRPFLASTIDSQLNDAAIFFLSDTTKNIVDGKTLKLSEIFKWYGDDFNKINKDGYLGYIKDILRLEKTDYKVKFLKYNWSLNNSK